MKSIYNYVISPVGERYNNKKQIDDKSLILNTEIFNHEYVNRKGVVIDVPAIGNPQIKKGEEVIVHHNVFRRWHDIKGVERNSKAWFKENIYLVNEEQIFLRKIKTPWTRFKEPIWKPLNGFCFIKPLVSIDEWDNEQEHATKGVIKYTDGSFKKGEVVGFTPFSKYEFIIDGEKLYRVYSKFITIKYEYKGNEETYNPSWAQSG